MPLGERLLRAVEGRLLPWFDRADADAKLATADELLVAEDEKAEHTEAIRQDSIAARIDSERVRKDYALMSKRLSRR